MFSYKKTNFIQFIQHFDQKGLFLHRMLNDDKHIFFVEIIIDDEVIWMGDINIHEDIEKIKEIESKINVLFKINYHAKEKNS